jgi:hypothetical protein
MNDGIKPTFFNEFSSLKVMQKPEKEEIDNDAIALANLKDSDGWAIVKDLIDRTIEDLDQMLLVKMAGGSQLTEIGQLAITNQLIKDVLNRIKSRVQDTPDR